MNYTFLADLIKAQEKHFEFNWKDALSRGQLESKQWILDNFPKEFENKHCFVLGGWVGILSWLLLHSNKILTIRSFDIDEKSNVIAKDLNRKYLSDNWKFQSSNIDIMNINGNYLKFNVKRNDNSIVQLNEKPELIINTICEHLNNCDIWWNNLIDDIPFIIQSNNAYQYPDHVNCHNTLEDFDNKFLCKKTLFIGEYKTENYTRFMKIGFK